MIVNSKIYDALKYIAQIVIPAAGTLYFALSSTWGLTNSSQVVGTLVAVDAFLGVLLHLSSKAYDNSDQKYDGSIDIAEDDTSKQYTLSLDGDPDDIHKKDQLVFKVNKEVKRKPRVRKAVKRAPKSL
jgi:small nuclear ribonucleoprotein (snRNP)-like protein